MPLRAPVPRMRRPPHSHPLHVLWPAEVILVLRLAQPAALTRRFARRPAGSLRAVLLPSAIAHIEGENLAAAPALALYFVRHGSLAWESIFADGRPAAVEPRAPTSAERKSTRIK